MNPLIRISGGITRNPAWRMAHPVSFEMLRGEHIAITGRNGAGKSMLVSMLTGQHPLLLRDPEYDFGPGQTSPYVSDNIKYITFRDNYGGDNDRTYFLQQRWNQMEIDPETPTAGRLLEQEYMLTGTDTPHRRALQNRLYTLFNIGHLLDKYIILLSSGEMRKFQLTRALLTNPRILIMDNPFIGLDADTRGQLKDLLALLAAEQSLQLILVLSKTDDIPDFITHVVEVNDMHVGRKQTLAEYRAEHAPRTDETPLLPAETVQQILDLPYRREPYHTDEVIRFKDVSIRYGARIILDRLNWTVNNGERWALSGQNGAGKSTLLSLVCADNPQSYACDISLFGHQRGTGESIWDIKRHIGYVSPEMHRAYQRDMPAIRIVASGLTDSVGLYVRPREEEYAVCRWWMALFGLAGKEETSFLKLSSGEQRLVLLARAFVKDPEMLILDEPLHGLDDDNRRRVRGIVDAFCQRKNKTLVYVTHYQEELPTCITHSIRLQRHV